MREVVLSGLGIIGTATQAVPEFANLLALLNSAGTEASAEVKETETAKDAAKTNDDRRAHGHGRIVHSPFQDRLLTVQLTKADCRVFRPKTSITTGRIEQQFRCR